VSGDALDDFDFLAADAEEGRQAGGKRKQKAGKRGSDGHHGSHHGGDGGGDGAADGEPPRRQGKKGGAKVVKF
jgi:hypothetical protein